MNSEINKGGYEQQEENVYCPNCGKQISILTNFCSNCGKSLTRSGGVSSETRVSGIAIASFVLGLFNIIPIIGAILAIVFGKKAKIAIESDPELTGRGLATTGIVLGWISLICTIVASIIIIAALVIPATRGAIEQAKRADCMSNLKQAGLAIHMYAQDNAGRFPESLKQVYPEYISSLKLFVCPSRKKIKEKSVLKDFNLCYEYVVGKITEHYPVECLLMFDKEDNHNKEGRNAVFVDGHVEWIPEENWNSIWQNHLSEIEEKSSASALPLPSLGYQSYSIPTQPALPKGQRFQNSDW